MIEYTMLFSSIIRKGLWWRRNPYCAHGVQSVGITTTFNLEQVFELGQLAIYENVEGTPDVEVTMSKVLDGYIPLFCLATATKPMGQHWLKERTVSASFSLGFGMKLESLLVKQVQTLALFVKCQVLLFPL